MAAIDTKIILTPDGAHQITETAGVSKTETKDLGSFFAELSKDAYFDTGILPLDGSGVLSIREAMGHTQIVFQHAPDVYRVIWGEYEGSAAAKHYDLAQPFRIVIGDFVDGNFLGARHFYSPVPIVSRDQVLYNVNLPNLNCKGYGHGGDAVVGQNGVGWICLYHNHNTKDFSLAQKIMYLTERAGGTEAYNDANMSGTDGPRYYNEQYKSMYPNDYAHFSYLWDPQQWEAKSKEEGVGWTLNPDIWLPIKVKDLDSQDRNVPDGIPYTVGMAMDGKYRAYYGDQLVPKNYQKFDRDDLPLPEASSVYAKVKTAFSRATEGKELGEKPVFDAVLPAGGTVHYTCATCGDKFEEDSITKTELEGYICNGCLAENYAACQGCNGVYHFSHLQFVDNGLFCGGCKTVFSCQSCHSQLTDPSEVIQGMWCVHCTTSTLCDSCGTVVASQNAQSVQAGVPGQEGLGTFNLCNSCFSEHIICACGFLRPQQDTGLVEGGKYACGPCINYHPNGQPFHNAWSNMAPTADVPVEIQGSTQPEEVPPPQGFAINTPFVPVNLDNNF